MLDDLQRMKLYRQLNPNELEERQFRMIENEIKHSNSKTISDERFDFILWCRGYPSRQQYFLKYIQKWITKDQKILEVGCGRTGILSRLLAEKGFIVTGIDPKINLLDYNVKESKAHFIKEEFNWEKFDLSKYDYVIAQEPCEATEHVVRACSRQNVPFIMILCGVPHRLISGEMQEDVESWYNYLVSIDSENIVLRYADINPLLQTPILRRKKK